MYYVYLYIPGERLGIFTSRLTKSADLALFQLKNTLFSWLTSPMPEVNQIGLRLTNADPFPTFTIPFNLFERSRPVSLPRALFLQ